METNKDSANLDLLRAAAVMSVYFAHLHTNLSGQHSDLPWHFGQLGVLMFFVHTSLVLMMSMERMVANANFIPGFYVRRWFRIYPLSIFCVLMSYWFHMGTQPEGGGVWSVGDLVFNL